MQSSFCDAARRDSDCEVMLVVDSDFGSLADALLSDNLAESDGNPPPLSRQDILYRKRRCRSVFRCFGVNLTAPGNFHLTHTDERVLI